MRTQRPKNRWGSCNACDAKHANGDKPHQHDGSENIADKVCAHALHEEEPQEDGHTNRDHHSRQLWCIEFQPFNRTKHRDGRRNYTVPVEQRGADQPHCQKRGPPASRPCVSGIEQRQHGDDSTLAAVVGSQDQNGILEGHDEHERPEDQRDYTKHGGRRQRSA
jgi:hypothetical protein